MGLKAVIVQGDKALISQRGSGADKHEGLWDLPGGRIEFGDSIEEGIKREVKEEIDLELSSVGRALTVDTFNPQHKPDLQIVRITFRCSCDESHCQLNPEVAKTAWVTKANLANYNFIDSIIKQAVEAALDNK